MDATENGIGAIFEDNKPLLNRVRRLACEGKLDALIVYGPDRLSGNTSVVAFIIGEITKAGVELAIVQKP